MRKGSEKSATHVFVSVIGTVLSNVNLLNSSSVP